jgi:hypothetical protein
LLSFCCLLALGLTALAPTAARADDPSITGFSSSQVPLDSFVIIYGTSFGDFQGTGRVLIGGHQVPVMAWTGRAINIYVNPLAYNQPAIVLDMAYPVQVIRADGHTSNTLNLTITSATPPVYNPPVVDQPSKTDQPSISGFQKATFCPGNDVAIFGVGFGDAEGTSFVTVTVPFLDANGNTFTQVVALPVLAWASPKLVP